MPSSPYVTTEAGERQNVFPVEAKPELIENYSGYIEEAEKANGRWAMIGFIALLGSYISTSQIIPGIY
ncbi:high light inducible protein [Prochlorococcus marinus]|uniref:high light inducible protein n=1 Tax=Prochlorococcus marinus TaxID=1219 RepID=UPI0022B33893|nr:high light inducible protein [Prochlorococcus marinus]